MQLDFPTIQPLNPDVNRPFWSVLITAYKRTEYLEACLKSVLAQDLSPTEMHIEVVDDCSPNREKIEAIVKEVGQGRVSFYSQSQNVGIYSNWNTCIQRARGHWVHILSDDDLVISGFYERYKHFIENYECEVVLGQSIFINEAGQWVDVSLPLQETSGLLDNPLMTLGKGNQVRTPGIVVARRAYEEVGGFTTNLVYTPDWEMWSRLVASFKAAYVDRPYSLFRYHGGSETNRLVLSAVSVTDSLKASTIIQSRVSNPHAKREIRSYVNRWLGFESQRLSRKLLQDKQYKAALLHAIWFIRLIPSLSSFKNMGLIIIKLTYSLLVDIFIALQSKTTEAL